MINDKEYLKSLFIVRRNLQKFLCLYNQKGFDYLCYNTSNYLNVIDNEIDYIKKKIESKDRDFYNSLYTIYDFIGEW